MVLTSLAERKFAFQRAPVQLHRLRKISFRHCANGPRNFGRRAYEIVDQRIDGIRLGSPSAGRPVQRHALPQAAILTYSLTESRHLLGNTLLLRDGLIERRRDLPVRL
jgi:hypothetical protein